MLRALLGCALLAGAIAGNIALQGTEGEPLFAWIDPSRALSFDWGWLFEPLLLSALAITPSMGQAEPGTRRVSRGSCAATWAIILALYIIPQPLRFHDLQPARAGVDSVPAMVDGTLRQRQWMPLVDSRSPITALAAHIHSERALASVAWGISADSARTALMNRQIERQDAQRHARLRTWTWTAQGWITRAVLGLRVGLVPLGLLAILAALRPAKRPKGPAWLASAFILAMLLLPVLANGCLSLVSAWFGLPEAEGIAMGASLVSAGRGGTVAAAVAAGVLFRKTSAIPVAAACLLVVGCGSPVQEAPQPGPAAPVAATTLETQPDIVVFLASGWRADASDAQGAEAALYESFGGATSVRFANAYAQTPNPFTSLGSLLTGRYPSAIPMCGLADLVGHADTWCARLPAERDTIPRVLALYGYRTAIAVEGVPAHERLHGGFQHVVELEPAGATSTLELVDGVRPWWQGDPRRPRLLMVVLDDLLLHLRPDLVPGPEWATDPPRGLRPLVAKDPDLFRKLAGADSDALRQVQEFDAARVGAQLAGLLAVLADGEERPLVTVLGSLCGEDLGETGGSAGISPTFGADRLVLDRTIHVPLAIFGAGGQPRTVAQPVELVDVFPTLASLAGAVTPAGLPGQDLLASDFEEDPKATAYVEHGDMLALRQGPWLFTFRGMLHHGSSLDPALTTSLVNMRTRPVFSTLHQVVEDPHQTIDRFDAEAAVVGRMGTILEAMRKGVAAAPPGEMTPKRLWELRMTEAEGYW